MVRMHQSLNQHQFNDRGTNADEASGMDKGSQSQSAPISTMADPSIGGTRRCCVYKAAHDPDPGLYSAFEFEQIAIAWYYQMCISRLVRFSV